MTALDHASLARVGSDAPEFRAPSSHGQTLERASFLGRVPVALAFVGPVADPQTRLRIGALDRHLAEFGRARIQLLLVATGTARAVRDLGARHATPILADADSSIGEAYGVVGPSRRAVLIDRTGRVARVVDEDSPAAMAQELLRAARPAWAVTPSDGEGTSR